MAARRHSTALPPEAVEAFDEGRAGFTEWVPMSSSRVLEARYSTGLNQIHVIFRDGTPWVYDGVPENIWRSFKTSASPGQYINAVLNGFPYWRGGFDYD